MQINKKLHSILWQAATDAEAYHAGHLLQTQCC